MFTSSKMGHSRKPICKVQNQLVHPIQRNGGRSEGERRDGGPAHRQPAARPPAPATAAGRAARPPPLRCSARSSTTPSAASPSHSRAPRSPCSSSCRACPSHPTTCFALNASSSRSAHPSTPLPSAQPPRRQRARRPLRQVRGPPRRPRRARGHPPPRRCLVELPPRSAHTPASPLCPPRSPCSPPCQAGPRSPGTLWWSSTSVPVISRLLVAC
jgi:hypothetical protein